MAKAAKLYQVEEPGTVQKYRARESHGRLWKSMVEPRGDIFLYGGVS